MDGYAQKASMWARLHQLEGEKFYMLVIRVFLLSQVRFTRNILLALCRGFLTWGTLRSIHSLASMRHPNIQ